jgi:hypothetical protein
MRPFGYDAVREERESVVSLDTCLETAWQKYLARRERIMEEVEASNYLPFNWRDVVDSSEMNRTLYRHAKQLLRPLHLSLAVLHHHLLMTHPLLLAKEDHISEDSGDLGLFVSAGYQLLEQREIVYDLDMPELHNLGAYLNRKHLIIRGNAGDNVGWRMVGTLTNEGSIGDKAADRMIGHFINHERVGDSSGTIYGTFSNTWRGIRERPDVFGRDNTRWNDILVEDRPAFLRDITNPTRLSYERLKDKLLWRYG